MVMICKKCGEPIPDVKIWGTGWCDCKAFVKEQEKGK